MLWLDEHSRTLKRLSAYIDGQLSSRETSALETHLVACESCRRQLDELRATITAVGGLAEAEPPRSFALTPQMLERRGAVTHVPTPRLAIGMRLAGAGVALVLALVLVGDLGGVGGRTGSGGDRQAAEMQMTNSDNAGSRSLLPAPAATGGPEEFAAGGADQASPGDLTATGENKAACPPNAARSSARADAGAAESSAGATSVPTTAPEPAPNAAAGDAGVDACAPAADGGPAATGTPNILALQDRDESEPASSPETASDGDSGISALTVAEIVLAGALFALVVGIAAEYMLRRRAA